MMYMDDRTGATMSTSTTRSTGTGRNNNSIRRRRMPSILFSVFVAALGGTRSASVAAFGTTASSKAAAAAAVRGANNAVLPTSPGGRSSIIDTHASSSNSMTNVLKTSNPKPSFSSSSSDIISRKAALVDSTPDGATTTQTATKRIRTRIRKILSVPSSKRKTAVEEVTDIDAMLHVLRQGRDRGEYTAVMFHAPFCRACKASLPLFEKLARRRRYSNKKKGSSRVKFFSVAVTQENSERIKEVFSVTKFPVAHIYDPNRGRVDELPVLRKLFPNFERRLESVLLASPSSAVVSAAPSQ